MTISPFAGKPAPAQLLVDIPRLVTAYYTGQPDAAISTQRVAFGTSGHRGSSFELSFNEWHVLAISQAICLYREAQGINGPLFVGLDTHALSTPAGASALEVLAELRTKRGGDQACHRVHAAAGQLEAAQGDDAARLHAEQPGVHRKPQPLIF